MRSPDRLDVFDVLFCVKDELEQHISLASEWQTLSRAGLGRKIHLVKSPKGGVAESPTALGE